MITKLCKLPKKSNSMNSNERQTERKEEGTEERTINTLVLLQSHVIFRLFPISKAE